MKYEVFSDASFSVKKHTAGIGYYIRTKKAQIPTFVTQGSNVFYNCASIEVAEAVALGNAIRELRNKVDIKPTDRVDIFIDSARVHEYYSLKMAGKPIVDSPRWLQHDPPKVRDTWCSLQDLMSSVVQVKLNWLSSHQGTTNGNAVADRLAATALGTVH